MIGMFHDTEIMDQTADCTLDLGSLCAKEQYRFTFSGMGVKRTEFSFVTKMIVIGKIQVDEVHLMEKSKE